MIYTYKCPSCDHVEDVSHSMNETSNPSEETIMKITCNESTCPAIKKGLLDDSQTASYGIAWNRVFTPPNILAFGSGDSMKGGTLSKEDKIKKLQKRADDHGRKKSLVDQKEHLDRDFKNQAIQKLNEKRDD